MGRITTNNNNLKNYDNCYSDFEYGWSWYISEAQLRHNSNGTGSRYGEKPKAGDICGITVDTSNGTLSYSIN